MRKFYLFAAIVFLGCLLIIETASSGQSKSISGIYSDLHYNDEGGDLLGMELFIFPSGPGPELKYSVLVQISEGGAPVAALVPLIVKGTTITFNLPPSHVYANIGFSGKLVGDELLIRWSTGTEQRLKRGKSYWQ